MTDWECDICTPFSSCEYHAKRVADLSMHLPAGLRCSDCKFISYCRSLFQCDETNTWCDWAPSRFVKKATP